MLLVEGLVDKQVENLLNIEPLRSYTAQVKYHVFSNCSQTVVNSLDGVTDKIQVALASSFMAGVYRHMWKRDAFSLHTSLLMFEETTLLIPSKLHMK
jgi:hypothetical protein